MLERPIDESLVTKPASQLLLESCDGDQVLRGPLVLVLDRRVARQQYLGQVRQANRLAGRHVRCAFDANDSDPR